MLALALGAWQPTAGVTNAYHVTLQHWSNVWTNQALPYGLTPHLFQWYKVWGSSKEEISGLDLTMQQYTML